MSYRSALGLALMALPFVVVIVSMVRDIGWRGTLCVWGLVLAFCACVALGQTLLVRGMTP